MPASFKRFKAWQKDFLSRRPHRTLQLTRRRDYVRSLELPGYLSFTNYVNKMLWSNRKLFLSLSGLYLILFVALIGLGSQETYNLLTDTLQETTSGVSAGDFSQIGQAGLLFLTIATVGITESPTEGQQIYTVLLALMVWLTTVWLLRNKMAGHKVKLRDGLYNAGAPLLSTFLVGLVLLVQLIPILLAVIAYGAATSTGLLDGGVEAMLFWIAATLLGLLSVFWATSTLFAMVIVTLPGMYPLEALRNAGDIVLGRRVRILLRWLWMLLPLAALWVAILVPVILIDLWLKGIWPVIATVPIVPVVLLMLGTVSIIWSSSYIYLLYRKVVDERSN